MPDEPMHILLNTAAAVRGLPRALPAWVLVIVSIVKDHLIRPARAHARRPGDAAGLLRDRLCRLAVSDEPSRVGV